MASATITFIPVGNGDMTLIALPDAAGTQILVDCNIRDCTADASGKAPRDAAADLRARVKRDARGRPVVDAFLLSHPDEDHCRGLTKHFHLGPPELYPDDRKPDAEKRIFIREIWSSPLVFRRASRLHLLCDDAAAFNTEAKRRVAFNRGRYFAGVGEGNRILILGEDEHGKTDGLAPILVRLDELFSRINGEYNPYFEARLLAPLPPDSADTEEVLSKNHSSTILNIGVTDIGGEAPCRFLTGGDAEVAIWERLWQRHGAQPWVLAYNLLQTPHHCSWHSFSWDSWSTYRERARVSPAARAALGQIRLSGVIVASSNPIRDDGIDPPCIGAKREYQRIADGAGGRFICTGEHPSVAAPAPLELHVQPDGAVSLAALSPPLVPPRPVSALRAAAAVPTAGFTFPAKAVVPNKPAGFA